MKHLAIICCALIVTACAFDPGGAPPDEEDSTDGGSDVDTDAGSGLDGSTDLDGGADPDAAWPAPAATITCTSEAIDGYPKIVLTFGGDIASGFLGTDPGGAIDAIEYGSSHEDFAVASGCVSTWAVPYPSGCNKHSAVWGAAPRLILEPEVDHLNVALHYHDGTIRWGDLKTADGDSVGFTVTGLDCRIELVDGGEGGTIRTKP